jgi:hypothetical protein
MEHGIQVRCRDCTTGWVTISSQEDVPDAPHKRCKACNRKSHAQRAKRRAQEPKPRGRPLKKKSNRGRKPKYVDQGGKKGDGDGDKLLAAQPPIPPPASRPRGRPPKQRPDTGGRQTAESLPALFTRLPTRHMRQGSELASPPKRPKPLYDAASFLISFAVPRGGTERDDLTRDGRQNKKGEREDDEEEESAV